VSRAGASVDIIKFVNSDRDSARGPIDVGGGNEFCQLVEGARVVGRQWRLGFTDT
jgi:hypothetical protein